MTRIWLPFEYQTYLKFSIRVGRDDVNEFDFVWLFNLSISGGAIDHEVPDDSTKLKVEPIESVLELDKDLEFAIWRQFYALNQIIAASTILRFNGCK